MLPRISKPFLFTALLSSHLAVAQPQEPSIQKFANPGGGTLIVTSYSNSNAQEAALRMLHGVHTEFGSKPVPRNILSNKKDNLLALTFDVKSAKDGQSYSGLIFLAGVPGGQQAALLFDQSGRFPRSGPQMLGKLFEGPAGAPAPSVSPLEPVSFPDGTAQVGVPSGWKLARAGHGSGLVLGPSGEACALNVNYTLMDPRSNLARFADTALPLGTDPARAWLVCSQRLAQKNRATPPTIEIASEQPAPGGGYTAKGQLDLHDGMGVRAFQAHLDTYQPGGATWNLMVTCFSMPKTLSAKEWNTGLAVCASFQVNDQALARDQVARTRERTAQWQASQIRMQAQQQSVEVQHAAFWSRWDTLSRTYQANANVTREQTVLTDSQGNHGTVDNPMADYLLKYHPDEFSQVPIKNYIKGTDYY